MMSSEDISVFLQNLRRNRTAQRLGYFLGAFWLLMFAGLVISIPRWRHLYQTVQQQRQLEKTLNREGQEEQVLANWNWQEVEQRAKLARLAFPRKDDIQLILFALEEPSRRNNFIIERFDFDIGVIKAASDTGHPGARNSKTTKINKKPDMVSVNFSVVGPAANLIPFLRDLEESLPLISISEFSSQHQAKGEKGSLANVHLKLKMYFSGRQPKIAAAARFKAKDFLLSKMEMETVGVLRSFYDRSKLLFQKLQIIKDNAASQPPAPRPNPFSAAPTP